PEGERRIDLVLDLDDGVQNHRPAGVEVQLEAVDPRRLAVLGIPAIDLEGLHALGAGRGLDGLALADLGVGRQREVDHWCRSSIRRSDAVFRVSRPAPWADRKSVV